MSDRDTDEELWVSRPFWALSEQLMERIAQLPRSRQQFIIQVIESVLAQRP